MASEDAELGAASPESTRCHDDPTVQSSTTNAKDLGPARARLLKCLLYLALVMVVVSVASIIVGILALVESGSSFPYTLGGGLIAGCMALLLTICPFCLFCEGKMSENKLTGKFRCCVILMAIWFSFAICGILVGFGFSGIWGLIECIQAEKKAGYLDINPCVENTSSKYTLSLATLVLTGILAVLAVIIVCFTCRRAFGYLSKLERRMAYYKRIARPEILRELEAEERNRNQRTDHRRDVNDRRYQRPRDPNSPSLESNNRNRDHSPREPSAPQADGYSVNRDRSPYRGGDYPRPSAPTLENRDRRPNDNHTRGGHRQGAPRRHRERTKKDENEAPPPSYDEVLRKELKIDDV